MHKIYKIQTSSLQLELKRIESGIVLSRIYDRKAKQTIFDGSASLFEIKTRRAGGEEISCANTSFGWKKIDVVMCEGVAFASLAENSAIPGVSASVSITNKNDTIEWNVSLVSSSSGSTLYSCGYPSLPFLCSDDMKFMSPYGCGEVWSSSAEELSSTQNYPSYGVSMQYFALWNEKTKRGMYYGVHDGTAAYKQFSFKKEKGSDICTLSAAMPMRDISHIHNSQSLSGTLIWKLFDGDWYDAAMIYREWALANASWIPENTSGVRNDVPEWVRKNAHWWLVRIGSDDSYADTVIRCNMELGLSCSAVHMYDWHKIPFDNDYPHYFPVKENMLTGLYKLKRSGVRVMPYINGRLWDTRDKGLEDWQFSSVAKPGCTKNVHGEPFIETYSSKEEDGSPVKLAIMCPSSAIWQEKVTETVSKLLNEYKVNAVYIDQIAAASPYLCEDKNHSHQPGGGSWWCESYANLLDHIGLVKPVNTVVSTECTAEPFMKNIQMYLTWLWVKNNQVPAFPAVYSGLVTMFGRRYSTFSDDDDQGQRMTISESLVYGEQLGWIDPATYEKLKHRVFYNKCVRFRFANYEYFSQGHMLRPPVVTDDAEKLFTDKDRDAYGGILTHSPVYAGLWQRVHDGSKLLILLNASEQTVKCKVKCDIANGQYILEGEYSRRQIIRGGKFSCSLEPFSVNYIRTGEGIKTQ
ncbi:MAG TPA: DUF6259 domain-containing protein [Bacillota bacterium]|nr:DUF6259 domain-containing protein [Bacillota bacterium]